MSQSKVLEDRIRAAIRLSRVVVNVLEDADNHRSGYYRSANEIPELVQAAREYEELDRLARAEATR